MQRSKPYPFWLLWLDLILIFLTAGGWIWIIAIRELYRFFGPRPKNSV